MRVRKNFLSFWIVVFLSWGATRPAQPASEPPPTPTPDRLRPPPTVASPTQADEGAQLYWLHCQPCHGDRGQGLTDEWRAQYPPDHQNCWKSQCHGDRPYWNGFTLPTTVPAVIGSQTLARFATAADLHAFISQKMPFQAPGSLKPGEYWAVTAFLLRSHGLPDSALPITSDDQAALIKFVLRTSPAEVVVVLPSQPDRRPLWISISAISVLLIGFGWITRRKINFHWRRPL